MKIFLYKTRSENIRLKKELTDTIELSGSLRNECSIIRPVIEIETSTNISIYNYVYIPDFNRYYFISDIVATYNGIWVLSLKCDVLMSYASEIKKLKVTVLRNSAEYNTMLEDNQLKTYADSRIQCYNFPKALTPVSDNQFKYYLTVIGGGD